MPTGYTAKLYEGEQSFEEFVWGCARGMGAFIHMREDSFDKPLYEPEPDDHYLRAKERAELELKVALEMTPEQVEDAAAEVFAKASIEHVRSEARRKRLVERFEHRIAEVQAWIPPSSEHEGFKRFMLEQLDTSIQFERQPRSAPVRVTGKAWHAERVQALQRNVDYYAEEHLKVTASLTRRIAWIRALRESVPPPAPPLAAGEARRSREDGT